MVLSELNRITIETSTHCNAGCPHCARYDLNGNLHPSLVLGHLDINGIINNLQIDKLTNLQQVIIQGDKGDPLMNPDLERLIDAFTLAPLHPEILINTNGSIRSQKWWESLPKKYPDVKIMFSIDGLQDTNHLYRVGLDFQTIIRNARAFIDTGGYAIWRFLIFQHNQHQIEQALEISKNLGFSEFECVSADRGRFQEKNTWPVMVKGKMSHYISPMTNNITFSNRKVIHKKSNKNKTYISTPNKSYICRWAQQGEIYINAQAKVLPCCMMHFETSNNYNGSAYLKKLTNGFDQQDLTLYTLDDILKHDLLRENLENSLRNGKWHSVCTKSCKEHILKNIKQ